MPDTKKPVTGLGDLPVDALGVVASHLELPDIAHLRVDKSLRHKIGSNAAIWQNQTAKYLGAEVASAAGANCSFSFFQTASHQLEHSDLNEVQAQLFDYVETENITGIAALTISINDLEVRDYYGKTVIDRAKGDHKILDAILASIVSRDNWSSCNYFAFSHRVLLLNQVKVVEKNVNLIMPCININMFIRSVIRYGYTEILDIFLKEKGFKERISHENWNDYAFQVAARNPEVIKRLRAAGMLCNESVTFVVNFYELKRDSNLETAQKLFDRFQVYDLNSSKFFIEVAKIAIQHHYREVEQCVLNVLKSNYFEKDLRNSVMEKMSRCAATYNNVLFMKRLIELGIDYLKRNKDNDNLLMIAAREGCAGMVSFLLTFSYSPDRVKYSHDDYMQALLCALSGEHNLVIRVFLPWFKQKKITIDINADISKQVFEKIFSTSAKEIVQLLQIFLDAGTDLNDCLRVGIQWHLHELIMSAEPPLKLIEELLEKGVKYSSKSFNQAWAKNSNKVVYLLSCYPENKLEDEPKPASAPKPKHRSRCSIS